MSPKFIIDFDSTFITTEALDTLAAVALENNLKKEKIIQKIKDITTQGMEGKIDFSTSLQKRLSLFAPTKKSIEKTIEILLTKITPSVLKNKEFFKTYAKDIYIVSGGFIEYIVPVVKEFGIIKSHIFANSFIFDQNGKVIGYDVSNPLSKKEGKAKAVESLHFSEKQEVYIIGDGYTDYEIKKAGYVSKFFAFVENTHRSLITEKADGILHNFDELLYFLKLPRATSYPKSKLKVLLLENIHQNAYEAFIKEGYQVTTVGSALTEEILREREDINIIGIGSRTQITKEVLKKAPKLLAVARFGIGTNNIDLAACNDYGVAVFNAPFSNTRSVVELALGEVLLLARRIFEKNEKLHQGIWDKSAKNCHELRGKKLGIIGYGNIGSQLSVLAEMIGMEVYFYDCVEKLALGNAKPCQSLEELLPLVDIISLHVDGRKENKNLIGEKEFGLMKNGVIFVNTSRGHVVDIDALAKNIKSGKVLGAGVDVFPTEPKSNEEKFVSALQGLPNVVLTPHIGGRSEEAQAHMGKFVPEKVISFINTGTTTLSVNFPNLQLPDHPNAHRFIHIHKNVPGVLAKINNIFAQEKANIVGQYLKTNETIGYVITDIAKDYDTKIIAQLKEIPNTIRVRELY